MPCQSPPPIAPMEKAAPKSLRMTHGLVESQKRTAVRLNAGKHTKDLSYGQRGPFFRESRMFSTRTGGKGSAGVTVTGRMSDVHVGDGTSHVARYAWSLPSPIYLKNASMAVDGHRNDQRRLQVYVDVPPR